MIPKAPEYLSELAKEEWNRLAPDLFGDSPDRRHLRLFEMYCMSYAIWREAEARLQEEGLIQVTPNGHEQPHPAVSIRNQMLDRCQKLANNLGLTPESRAKVALAHKKEEDKDPWEVLKASRAKAARPLAS